MTGLVYTFYMSNGMPSKKIHNDLQKKNQMTKLFISQKKTGFDSK